MNENPPTTRLQAGIEAARRLYVVAVGLLLAAYLGSGITVVAPGEGAVILRCGQLLRDGEAAIVHPAGLLLAWPEPFERVIRLPVMQEQRVLIEDFWTCPPNDEGASPGEPQYVLCGDHNLLRLELGAKYRIAEPGAYVTRSDSATALVVACVKAAVTAVLQECSMDEGLRLRREEGGGHVLMSDLFRERTQRHLSACGCGLQITSVEIKQALPPTEVLAEFEAVQTARIEQETVLEDMRGERAQTLLEAEAEARQVQSEAQGALQSRIAEAHAQAAHFQADVEMYFRWPAATLERLHREAWQEILSQSRHLYFAPNQIEGSVVRIPIALPEGKR